MLTYKLKNILLEYEMIRSKALADEAQSVYSAGKEFLYDSCAARRGCHARKKNTDTRPNLRVNPQRRSLKGIVLLFVELYVAGARDSEKNPI